MTLAIYEILKAGGLGRGGFNFDAKLRRQSIDREDLFHAHIGGMDTLARALLAADRLLAEGRLVDALEHRYAGWSAPLGQEILGGEASLEELWERTRNSGCNESTRWERSVGGLRVSVRPIRP